MQQCQQTGQDPQIWWFPPQGSLCSPERQKQLLMIYCGYNTRNELVKEYIGDVNGPIIYTNTTEAISNKKYYTQHTPWRFQTPYTNSCAHLCPPHDESSSDNLHPLQMLQGVVANTPSYLLVKNVSGNIPPPPTHALSHWNHFTPNFPTLDTDVLSVLVYSITKHSFMVFTMSPRLPIVILPANDTIEPKWTAHLPHTPAWHRQYTHTRPCKW